MDPNEQPANSYIAPVQEVCPVCHLPVLPEYYFCPNCGANLHPPPLPTSIEKQFLLYAFSIVLPMICYLAISKWEGLKYFRSSDEKARRIGMVACTLLTLSTIVTCWYAYVWTEDAIQTSVAQVNADMSI